MGQTLAEMVGSYDNLSEPMPLLNKKQTIVAIIATVESISWTCGLLRLWTRKFVINDLGWDDFFTLMAMLITTMGSIMVCVGAYHFGLGQHFVEIGGPQSMERYLKGFYITNASYMVATTCIKLALLLQYLRLFERGTFLHRTAVILTAFASIWGTAYTLLALFPCSPISDYWSLKPDAHCWAFASPNPKQFAATFETHAILNMLFDIVILILPIPLYFRAGTVGKTKRGLAGLAILGFLVIFVAIWRSATLIEHRAATSPTFDPTWYGCSSIVLSALEVDLAVICASIPVFWPVLKTAGWEVFITKEVHVESQSRHNSRDSELMELAPAGMPFTGAAHDVGNFTTVDHNMREPEKVKGFDDDGSEETLRHISSGESKKSTDFMMEYADPLSEPFRKSRRSPALPLSKPPRAKRRDKDSEL